MSRNAGRTWRSSNPIVATRVRFGNDSPDEELHPRRGFHNALPRIGGMGVPFDRSFVLQLAEVVVHRRLVDTKSAGKSGLREVLVAVLDKETQHLPLFRSEAFAIR